MSAIPPASPSPIDSKQLESLLQSHGAADAKVTGFKIDEGKADVTFYVTIGTKAWKFVVGEENVFNAISKGDNSALTKDWAKGIAANLIQMKEDDSIRTIHFSYSNKTLTVNGRKFNFNEVDANQASYHKIYNELKGKKAELDGHYDAWTTLNNNIAHLQNQLDKAKKKDKPDFFAALQRLSHQKTQLEGTITRAKNEIGNLEREILPFQVASAVSQIFAGMGFDYTAPGVGGASVASAVDPDHVPRHTDDATVPSPAGGTAASASSNPPVDLPPTAAAPAAQPAFDEVSFKADFLRTHTEAEDQRNHLISEMQQAILEEPHVPEKIWALVELVDKLIPAARNLEVIDVPNPLTSEKLEENLHNIADENDRVITCKEMLRDQLLLDAPNFPLIFILNEYLQTHD